MNARPRWRARADHLAGWSPDGSRAPTSPSNRSRWSPFSAPAATRCRQLGLNSAPARARRKLAVVLTKDGASYLFAQRRRRRRGAPASSAGSANPSSRPTASSSTSPRTRQRRPTACRPAAARPAHHLRGSYNVTPRRRRTAEHGLRRPQRRALQLALMNGHAPDADPHRLGRDESPSFAPTTDVLCGWWTLAAVSSDSRVKQALGSGGRRARPAWAPAVIFKWR